MHVKQDRAGWVPSGARALLLWPGRYCGSRRDAGPSLGRVALTVAQFGSSSWCPVAGSLLGLRSGPPVRAVCPQSQRATSAERPAGAQSARDSEQLVQGASLSL